MATLIGTRATKPAARNFTRNHSNGNGESGRWIQVLPNVWTRPDRLTFYQLTRSDGAWQIWTLDTDDMRVLRRQAKRQEIRHFRRKLGATDWSASEEAAIQTQITTAQAELAAIEAE